MSRNVEITIFQIARTSVDAEAVRAWLDHLGATEFEIPSADVVTDPALLIALAAKRCYMSFEPGLNPNVTKVRRDHVEYLDNILKSGHGSVMEHACYSFAIEGVSRVFTAELDRHRAGVGISEASMRYIRYRDIPWWMPTSIRENPDDTVALAEKKRRTREVFHAHFRETESNYQALQDIWAEELAPESKFADKKHITSMMRRIIPMGVATGGVWTMNMRAVRHILALRTSSAAEEEIAHVFSRVARLMVGSEPMLLGDFSEDGGIWTPKYPKV